MRKTVNDILLSLGESAQEEHLNLNADMAIYQKLSKELPRLFPMPDEFYTKTASVSDYDAMFVYIVKKDEHPEALRIILSMMMGLLDWEIEIDRACMYASLRSIKYFGNYTLLIKLVGIDPDQFEYNITNNTGTLLTGPVKCRKFVELDTPRDDVSPEVFYDRLKTSSYKSLIYSKQAYICSVAAQGLPSQLPIPDEIMPALGMTYDLDLSYIADNTGKLRENIDQLLGYTGWSAVIDKKTGFFSLHTIVSVQCPKHILKVRVNILNAKREKEQLFMLADMPERLIYRATRPSDPDHQEIVAIFEDSNGSC
jgi:hypothetical protein